uniref:G-protein coupled receptors family 1 profile domain-containing protein n=1 Tax=Buteo japonicus TaxID=224669 RepID=A0A8C0BRQ0_9AVES
MSKTYTYCTILHITIVSVERYFAICFPLKAKATITKCRVKWLILVLWGCFLLITSPILFLFGVEHPKGSLSQKSQECRSIKRVAHMGLLEMMTWVFTISFFLPMLCLALLYGFIGRKCWWSGQRLPGCGQEKVPLMLSSSLAVVVLAFVLCWLPFHVGQILFAQSEIILYDLTQYFNLIAMLLFYLGASINPILYNIMLHKYRKVMRKILPKRTRCCRSQTRSEKVSLDSTELGSFTSNVQH